MIIVGVFIKSKRNNKQINSATIAIAQTEKRKRSLSWVDYFLSKKVQRQPIRS